MANEPVRSDGRSGPRASPVYYQNRAGDDDSTLAIIVIRRPSPRLVLRLTVYRRRIEIFSLAYARPVNRPNDKFIINAAAAAGVALCVCDRQLLAARLHLDADCCL